MIRVELKAIPTGEQEHRVVASLSVADDGTYQLDDPDQLFPTTLHVVVSEGDAGLRRVRFEDDPETWARNLGSLLRGGYLVPVITKPSPEQVTEPTPVSTPETHPDAGR